jgi:hypothetical protein
VRLVPGKTVELGGVVVINDDLDRLGEGEYGIAASCQYGDLTLTADPTRLVVTRNGRDPRISKVT